MSATTTVAYMLSKAFPVDWGAVKVRVENPQFDLWYVYQMYKSGDIYIHPAYQRGYVWDEGTASRWIETLYLDLPRPPLIFAENIFGKRYVVVDGVQRLLTIVRYFDGEFVPKKIVSEISDKPFTKLPVHLQNVIKNRKLNILSFSIEAPDEETKLLAVLEIFRRINLGARRLTIAQVLFCSVPSKMVFALRDLAEEELHELLDFKEYEERDIYHYILALDLAYTIRAAMKGADVPNLGQRGRVDKLPELVRFITINSESEVRRIIEEARSVVRLMIDIGFKRTHFLANTYGYTKAAKEMISPFIFCIVAYVLYRLKKQVGEEFLVKNSQIILDTVLNSMKADRKIDMCKYTEYIGKTVKEVIDEAKSSSRDRPVVALASYLELKLRKALGIV
jgi:hypothetical protein